MRSPPACEAETVPTSTLAVRLSPAHRRRRARFAPRASAAAGLVSLVVWPGVSRRKKTATATAGNGSGLAVLVRRACCCGMERIVRRMPPDVPDAIAAVTVTGHDAFRFRLGYTGVA